MRRRRLIGMYRVLLKSMNLVRSDDEDRDHGGAAAGAGTPGNRTRTRPVDRLADWPIQHNRPGPGTRRLYRPACDVPSVVSASYYRYLSARQPRRNEGWDTSGAKGRQETSGNVNHD